MYSLKKLNKLLERKNDSHKGQNGHVLVIAGSSQFSGAAILASVSALRVAADLVTLAAPEETCIAANSYCPDIITLKLPGNKLKLSHYSKIKDNLDKYDVIHIGNGIGLDSSTKSFVNKLINDKNVKKKMKVIDADALKLIKLQDVDNAILTPHKKELETLMKNSSIKEMDYLQQNLKNNIILLKGKVDKIITNEKSFLNKTGNPGMAKAGTGDVLSGLCSGILAKTFNLLETTKASAWLSGYIADILKKKKKGYYFIASDIIDEMDNIL